MIPLIRSRFARTTLLLSRNLGKMKRRPRLISLSANEVGGEGRGEVEFSSAAPRPVPPHEPRSSRREEAHSNLVEGSQSLLTSAATVQGFNTRTLSGNSLPAPAIAGRGAGEMNFFESDDGFYKATTLSPPGGERAGRWLPPPFCFLRVAVKNCVSHHSRMRLTKIRKPLVRP